MHLLVLLTILLVAACTDEVAQKARIEQEVARRVAQEHQHLLEVNRMLTHVCVAGAILLLVVLVIAICIRAGRQSPAIPRPPPATVIQPPPELAHPLGYQPAATGRVLELPTGSSPAPQSKPPKAGQRKNRGNRHS